MARSNPKPWKAYGRYGTVGIELVLSIMLGWYAGHWADVRWGGGRGWVTALGFVIGTYAGFRALFLTAAKMQRDIEEAERREIDDWRDGPSPSADHDPTPDDRQEPHEPR
jgi:hypothetical protein